MSRVAFLLVVLVAISGCGPDDGLPPSVPPIQLDAGPLDAGAVDAGPVDAGGPQDAGAGFLAACADAGCASDVCEPVDGGLRCGVACGSACGTPCQVQRCPHGSDFVDVYCTSSGASPHTWSTDPHCDDLNPCTQGDICTAGSCVGAASPTSTTCDDNNVCTSGDHCDGAGGCTGTVVADLVDRYFNSGASAYAYAGSALFNFSGWVNNGHIFANVPGGQPVYLLFDSTQVDRILSLSTATGSYGSQGTVGTALDHSEPGTIQLEDAAYTCSGGDASLCNGKNRHYFLTPGHGSPPAGSASGSGIWVCPAP